MASHMWSTGIEQLTGTTISFVSVLLEDGCPSNIARLVVAVVVWEAIDRVFR